MKLVIGLCLALLSVTVFVSAENLLTNVSVSQPFFNPTLGQTIQLSFTVAQQGTVTAQVLDRDGVVARTLCMNKSVTKGSTTLMWEGRNDLNQIVPDEAYSWRIDFVFNGQKQTYFPANVIAEKVQTKLAYYDRQTGTLSYELAKPSRVHIQAGTAVQDPVTKKPKGPVLKTLVNREPRSAGKIIEHWNGFAQDGETYVPDLKNFAVAVAASSLPENSVITIGNHSTKFLESVAGRKGKSLFTYSVKDHHHHQGLATVDDVSPDLSIKPVNGVWSEADRAWKIKNNPLKLSCVLQGVSATSFANQPSDLYVFVDGNQVHKQKANQVELIVNVPLQKLSPGIHVVALNWASEYGPTTVAVLRLRAEGVN